MADQLTAKEAEILANFSWKIGLATSRMTPHAKLVIGEGLKSWLDEMAGNDDWTPALTAATREMLKTRGLIAPEEIQ